MKPAKILLGLFLAALFFIDVHSSHAGSADAALPDFITQDFSRPELFKPISAVGSLPREIIATTGSLAEPGRPYQETTLIANPPLPEGRLIWAVQNERECIVYYETGGFAHGYKLLIATLDGMPAKASVQWRGGTAHGSLGNFTAFIESWKKGGLIREWP